MKKTIIALSLAVFTMGIAAPVMAASHTKKTMKDVPCKPAKKGYVMVDGKCIKKPAEKKKTN